jgi:hypothetical protein
LPKKYPARSNPSPNREAYGNDILFFLRKRLHDRHVHHTFDEKRGLFVDASPLPMIQSVITALIGVFLLSMI